MQEIDSRAIAQAIINARWKGVSVRVFLEQDYIFDPKPADLVPGLRAANRAGGESRHGGAVERIRAYIAGEPAEVPDV